MGDLIAFLGSGAVGSVIGGVFALLNRKADIEAKRLEREHESRLWEHNLREREADLKIAQAEAAGKVEVAIIEGNAAFDTARMGAIAEASRADSVSAAEIKAAGKMGVLFVLVSAFSKAIRPVLTVALIGAALYVNWLLIYRLSSIWELLGQDAQLSTGMQAFSWVTAQASIVISYWFVARGSSGSR